MKRQIVFVLIFSLGFGLLAAGVSLLLPNQYTAEGLLVVSRKADPSSDKFFTYEGSYAQQNSNTYTATFMILLQNPTNLKLADTGMEIKKLTRLVKVKREGPQAIKLSVKAKNPEQSISIWTKIAQTALSSHSKLMEQADPLLTVTIAPGSPVVLNTYPEWQKVFALAWASSAVVIITVIMLLKYLRDDNDN